MAEVALGAAQWVVDKALAPVADGVLEAWVASRTFGLNIQALSTELLHVQATLETAVTKELAGRPATEKLLQNLRDSVHNAEDLLDELDYFRIHDDLHGTYDAAGQHGDGFIRDLARDARHTVKALCKLVNCFPWQHAELQQSSHGDLFSPSDTNQEVSGCMPNLGKFLLSSCSPHPHVHGDEDRGNAQETPMPEFNRVDFSQRMKNTIEQLKLRNEEVNKILTHCGPRTVLDISQRRSPTTPQSAEPKLYGRDNVMNSIIHDITVGQYCDKGLTVLPVIGPGGMGKTTLIQHIYNNQQMRNHFPVRIWICVSFNFNLEKVLEQIKRDTLSVEGEDGCSTTQELIEHRLRHKRFLLVLDDIWQFTDVDDWKKILLILGKSQKKGSMILVTTRQKEIADQVKKTVEPKELNALEHGEFRKLFLVYVFDAEHYPGDKLHLLDTGDEIMRKLKGFPLAAKTVGRLLRTDPSLAHWRRVLNSKQWAKQTNGIMPALKLSYDFLPFHLQQCFSYSGLFPEDYHFKSHELISLWIGLDILIPSGQNQTFEDIGLSNLTDLVIHGFFREEGTDGDLWYVMHDLLHDLALKVASHDCLNLRLSHVGSMEVQPSVRHLSISIDGLGEYGAVSGENLKSELEKLKTRFKVEHLQTLMLFGKMDEGFVKIFGDFFGEAAAFRVLHLPSMLCPVESMLHNFSGLVHLRYLSLGTKKWQMHIPLNISKFYHLRILDLVLWNGRPHMPKDMSNLGKLCHFYVPSDGELHSDIYNVGKLKLLEELKVFQVNKKSEGFEPKQLEHLTKLRELGIYNLEKIDTVEEAAQAKLMEKKYLRRLTLDWDSKQSSVEPGVEAAVLESLQPHGDLQVLCIRGHKCPSCPTWLGEEFAVEALQSLSLYCVSWEVFPSLRKAWDLRELRFEYIARPKVFIMEKSFCMLTELKFIGLRCFEKWVYPYEQDSFVGGDLLPPDAHMFPLLQILVIRQCPKLLGLPFSNHIVSPGWFPKLQVLEVLDCPAFLSLIPISWMRSLHCVEILGVKLLNNLEYSKSFNGVALNVIGEGDLHSLDQVLVFDNETGLEKLKLERCPPLELKHLLMLTSLKTLIVKSSDDLVRALGGQGDVECQLPVWFPKLQDLEICACPEFSLVIPISWMESLRRVEILRVKMPKEFSYSKSSDGARRSGLEIIGEGDLHTLDQVLVFDKETGLEKLKLERCPPLELKHLLKLTSLKVLIVRHSDGLVGPLGGQGDVEWQLPVEHMRIWESNGDTGEELTELLPHLPKLCKLEIWDCKNIKQLVVGVGVHETSEASEMEGGETTEAAEASGMGVLLFPAYLCDSLWELYISGCPELVLVDPPTLVPGGGWLQALQSLQRLRIVFSPKFLSAFSFSYHLFPSSLQFLELKCVEGMGTLEPLSNLSSLTRLELWNCGEDLKCKGLWSLLTTGGRLNELIVCGSPRFFAGWDLEDVEGGEEQQTQFVSSRLQELCTDDATGLLAAPICSLLSSSLTKLELIDGSEGMERFTKEQEDALQFLSSLQKLKFMSFYMLQQLPAGLCNLTSLRKLSINFCRAVSSLPSDGLPKSLQLLYVNYDCTEELKQQCRGLVGTIPEIIITTAPRS